MQISIDLHIHSCLSPCGSLEMSPLRIVREAAAAGLKVIALTDHNSARNHPAFRKTCAAAGLMPVFGIEVNTREEAHVLALFEDEEAAAELGSEIFRRLPDYPNLPDTLGDQVYVDENDVILGTVKKYLGNAADIGLEEVGEMIVRDGGMFIPSHIDRPFFSVVSQLGFLPDLPYTAVELTDPGNRGLCSAGGRRIPAVYTSDAHYPDDIGKRSSIIEIEAGGGSIFSRLLSAVARGEAVYHRS